MSCLIRWFGRALCTAWILALVATDGRAQVTEQEGPRVGVVLSGGSAKGFAHIGVLRELEAAGVPIHVITGTSMGAVVGGLYAIGYSPDEIEQIATEQNWHRLFSDAPDRRLLSRDGTWLDPGTRLTVPVVNGRVGLPTGIVKGQHIWQLLAHVPFRRTCRPDSRRFRTDHRRSDDRDRTPTAMASDPSGHARGHSQRAHRGRSVPWLPALIAAPVPAVGGKERRPSCTGVAGSPWKPRPENRLLAVRARAPSLARLPPG